MNGILTKKLLSNLKGLLFYLREVGKSLKAFLSFLYMIDNRLYYGYDTVKKCTTRVTQLKGGKAVLDFTKLELNTTEPVYVQIVSFVKRQIFTGAAEKGESLPSRRELAAILKINPNTVQKAFRLMEEEGIIVTPPNAVSDVHWDDEIYKKIQKELTAGLVAEFITHAKANGLELDDVISLIRKEWIRGEGK